MTDMKIVVKLAAIFLFTLTFSNHLLAQTDTVSTYRDRLDSIYIGSVESAPGKPKVLHAEPLYIDLIRDLGARKGEKEWNVGLGYTDGLRFSEYEALVEYEWAPIDRLGLEVELPFTLYQPGSPEVLRDSIPGNRLQSLKVAAQYTFLVNERSKTSLAIGYIHEFEVTEFRRIREDRVYSGNVYNPFLIAAKRWGQNYHTLIYAGPQLFQHIGGSGLEVVHQINSNFHYMIDGTRNFIGIEFNKEIYNGQFEMTMRPQMRVSLADNLLVGIVTGIPVNRQHERLSTFVRLIYEPGVSHR